MNPFKDLRDAAERVNTQLSTGLSESIIKAVESMMNQGMSPNEFGCYVNNLEKLYNKRMDKKHKLLIAATIAAVLIILMGVSAYAYEHYKHTQQVRANQAAQVSAAKAKKLVQAQNLVQSQLQGQTAKVNKIYAECISEAKKDKAANPGIVCAP